MEYSYTVSFPKYLFGIFPEEKKNDRTTTPNNKWDKKQRNEYTKNCWNDWMRMEFSVSYLYMRRGRPFIHDKKVFDWRLSILTKSVMPANVGAEDKSVFCDAINSKLHLWAALSLHAFARAIICSMHTIKVQIKQHSSGIIFFQFVDIDLVV